MKDGGETFHSLRHSFASLALNAGVPMDTVQKMGGWKTAATVRVYARRSEESIRQGEDKLAEILSLHAASKSAKTSAAAQATENAVSA